MSNLTSSKTSRNLREDTRPAFSHMATKRHGWSKWYKYFTHDKSSKWQLILLRNTTMHTAKLLKKRKTEENDIPWCNDAHKPPSVGQYMPTSISYDALICTHLCWPLRSFHLCFHITSTFFAVFCHFIYSDFGVIFLRTHIFYGDFLRTTRNALPTGFVQKWRWRGLEAR